MQSSFDPCAGGDYESYLAKGSPELRLRQEQAVATIRCSEAFLSGILAVEGPWTLAVFAETFCPDCVVTIPYVRTMELIQPRWTVRYFPRRGYENILRELTGDVGIPAVLAYNPAGLLSHIYVEFPSVLNKEWDTLESEAVEHRVRLFRAGMYRDVLEQALLELVREVCWSRETAVPSGATVSR